MVTGKTEYRFNHEKIAIFNQERTIIDAFRYLSKEIAIKALKSAVKSNRHDKLNLVKLQEYAVKFKVNIDPYILMVTT